MWFKCEDRLPPKDGIYMTAEKIGKHVIYRIIPFKKDLGDMGIDLAKYKGVSGFCDSDPEYGSFIVEPEAWKYIERYRG